MDGLDSLQGIQQQKLDILQGNKERVQKQHDDGKSAARERIAKLLDAGSFVETDAFKTEGNVVCGYGTVAERPAYVFAQDFTSQGGAFGTAQAEKILKTLDLAELTGAPVIALLDSAGAAIAEGARALSAYAKVFAKLARLSGVCPIISIVMGPCRGSAALFTQLSDISVLVEKTSDLQLHSELVLGKKLTVDELSAQGMTQLIVKSEERAGYRNS